MSQKRKKQTKNRLKTYWVAFPLMNGFKKQENQNS